MNDLDITPELIRAEAVKAVRRMMQYASDPTSEHHAWSVEFLREHVVDLANGLARNVVPAVDNEQH
jgi:hypothetical protein